ncbi:MAG: phosphoribosylformylglycinamidine synthase subunit PurS [Pseudomonadota bacterium]
MQHFVIEIRLREGILDPQGKAIANALQHLDLGDNLKVRQGKLIDITISHDDEAKAREAVASMCQELLVNPVMETYHIRKKTEEKCAPQ